MARESLDDSYELDDDLSRFDLDAAWDLLDRYAYWGRFRTRDAFARQIARSWRVLGAYHDGRLVGFGRSLADGEALGYLADLVVAPEHRGRGIGRALARGLVEDGPAAGWRWMLHTRDAHALYADLGFAPAGGTYLERPRPGEADRPEMAAEPLATSVLYVATFQVPTDGVAAFQAHERAVLPLLRDHGGRLERRLCSADGRFEVHLLRFPSDEALEAHRSDPRRATVAHLLAQSGATVHLERVLDVNPG